MTPTDQSGRAARVGVTSEQRQSISYRLEVRLNDARRPTVRSFALAPGESRVVSLGAGSSDRPTAVEATLFRRGHPDTVYRRVRGWLPAGGEAAR